MPLLSDDVIVTSLETTLSSYTVVITYRRRKRYNNIISNNFRDLKRIVPIFAKQHQRSKEKEKLTVELKSTSISSNFLGMFLSLDGVTDRRVQVRGDLVKELQ